MKHKLIATYKILNHESGTYYIGSSVNLYHRWAQHKTALRSGKSSNKHLQASWDAHGESCFVFVKLSEYEDVESAHKEENRLIAKHIDDPKCCNTALVANTPMLGRKHSQESKELMRNKMQAALLEGKAGKFIPSEETRQKMSEALKGNQCAKGYKRTEAERGAIRKRTMDNQQWLGRKHNPASVDKMGTTAYAVDPKGNETEYPSINAMREALGMAGLSNILKAIKTGFPFTTGPRAGWTFYTEKEDNRPVVPDEYKDLPRSRPEAKEIGAKMYYTGAPCKYGHVAPRKIKGTCVECAKIDGEKSNERKRQANKLT